MQPVTYEPPPNGFRTFVIVWITQSISVMGSALTLFASTIWLTQTLFPAPEQQPQLAAALSGVGLSAGIPTMLITPIAGAWADRHDRKQTMLVANILSGGLSLTMATLIAAGLLQLWMLFLILALLAILGAFHSSSFDTTYAMLVPQKQLPRANGMMQTIWSLSGILSPGIAAFVISLPALARQGFVPGGVGDWLAGLRDGAPLALTLDGVTFLLVAIVLPFVTIPSPLRTDLVGEGGKKKSIWADVREGAVYIKRRPPMLWLLGTFTVANFVLAPMGVLIPLMVKFNLQPDWAAKGFQYETALALLTTAGGVGGLIGGILISTWGGLKKRRVYGVLVPMIVGAIAQIFFGLSGLIFFSAALLFVRSFASPLLNAHSQAIWQMQTPRELQGRVFSVRRVIAQFTGPIGALVAGITGGSFDPGLVLTVLGSLSLLFYIGQLFNPYLMKVDDKEFIDQLAASKEKARELQLEAQAGDIRPNKA